MNGRKTKVLDFLLLSSLRLFDTFVGLVREEGSS
jgi:hypothetical protein